MAGATAFFTTFAISPILIIISQILSFFITSEQLSAQLILRIKRIAGPKVATLAEQTLENITDLAQNPLITIFGFLFLIFVATTLFSVIENSLIQIWQIGIKENAGFIFGLKRRFRSMIIILLAGLLFGVGLLTEGMQTILGNYIDYLFPSWGKYLNSTMNELVFIAITTIWFTCLFRFLSEGRPKFRVALAGGFLTAILFDVGKIIVAYCLSISRLGIIYGTSGSIVLTMLFVFYSSFIFYFGGCFIKVLSNAMNEPIRPGKEAYRYEIHQV